jgi:predicted heme/steroid binding protein
MKPSDISAHDGASPLRPQVDHERIFSELEIRRYNGENGLPRYIAYQGVVYDVSDCPKWRTEMHEQLHFPGQDLTGELPEAPHGEEVFSRPCVKRVGKLV